MHRQKRATGPALTTASLGVGDRVSINFPATLVAQACTAVGTVLRVETNQQSSNPTIIVGGWEGEHSNDGDVDLRQSDMGRVKLVEKKASDIPPFPSSSSSSSSSATAAGKSGTPRPCAFAS